MVLEPICCPNCHAANVVKNGKSAEGKQRYRCRNAECTRVSFILHYSYRGYWPEVKQQIADMAVDSSGIKPPACASRSEIPWLTDKTLETLMPP
ncbi:hypothetical protein C7293_17755 [filamentous cyanobacterium CCT1]|nr:hypothetical protein C7293_17755 [filamentous cyanobacterium CCT1]PSN79367.1 hypothetical protein C8B47_12045 [filamentous cyanobacterium CCP4]